MAVTLPSFNAVKKSMIDTAPNVMVKMPMARVAWLASIENYRSKNPVILQQVSISIGPTNIYA
jgi:hypothetical protein